MDLAARPAYAVWEVTLLCDLACKHCGSRAHKARNDELSTHEALDLVDQMAALGVEEVSLIGGEVYLRRDWTSIVRRVKQHGMLCGIVTGGYGFTRAVAERARDAGVDGVSVSLDGLEAAHDFQRGREGSYRRAIAALEALRDVGIDRAVNTQVNRRSKDDVPALLDVVAELGAYAWQVQFTVAMGRAADHPELLLQPYDLIEVVPRLAELAEECRRRKIRFEPGNNVGYFGPHEATFRRGMRREHHQGCGAGSNTLGIEADGKIKGCPSLTTHDYVGGNVRDAKLRDIWLGAAELRFTRERTTEDLWGFCKTCYYASECRAGCTWTSHVLFGQRGNNPYCHHRALELLESGERERIELVEAAPGEPFDHGRFALVREPWPVGESDEHRATRAETP